MNFGLANKKYHLNKTLFHSYPYRNSLYEARKTHKIFEKSLNFDDAPILWQQYLGRFCCMSSIIWLYWIDYIDRYLVTCQTKFMSTVKGIFYCIFYFIIFCEFIQNWSM